MPPAVFEAAAEKSGATLDRRSCEASLLALLSLSAVWSLRWQLEPPSLLLAEVAVVLGLFVANLILQVRSTGHRAVIALNVMQLIAPLIVASLGRATGAPAAFEMSALGMLGCASLVLALPQILPRHRPLSLVGSGFLLLFTLSISDSSTGLRWAIAWMALCMWHLVANHWQRLEVCMPHQVRLRTGVCWGAVLAGTALCLLGGFTARGRFADSEQLGWGIMPASGGSEWSDPAARSGVGSGDAAIAAKERAESFGAVDSDMFLEMNRPSLFDMFSETLGEPRVNKKTAPAQGLRAERLIHVHQKLTKSERSGGSFSTRRSKPMKSTKTKDVEEPAILQWVGPRGIRLAMHRYDTFDGVEWSQQGGQPPQQLVPRTNAEETWHFDPRFAHAESDAGLSYGVLRVLRLGSDRVPAPMLTAGLHIKDVDRSDFFGIEKDGSLSMPGREEIPPLTVLHLASSTVMEDELLDPTALKRTGKASGVRSSSVESSACGPKLGPGASALGSSVGPRRSAVGSGLGPSGLGPGASALGSGVVDRGETKGELLAAELAERWSSAGRTPYDKLKRVVAQLRSGFTFDRSAACDSADPLYDFLVRRRGGDHLFATAAAIMARSLGLQARLTTGFYVPPDDYDLSAGHTPVSVEDAHVWVEVALNDGRWIAIEPTPNYREPIFRESRWLVATRMAMAVWPYAVLLGAIAGLTYLSRRIWLEFLLRAAWWLGQPCSARPRLRLLLAILELRARFAKTPRAAGLSQRDWLMSIASSSEPLARSAAICCDAADHLVFGTRSADDGWLHEANFLVRTMTTAFFLRAEGEVMRAGGAV